MKYVKWGLAFILLVVVVLFIVKSNFANDQKAATKGNKKDSIPTEIVGVKNIDSLSVEEIRVRYLNNPCYLALLKDPSFWEKGTRAGFDYKDLINDSLPLNNPYRNRFIVGDFNSLSYAKKTSGIYEVYPSLTSLKEFSFIHDSILKKIDTTIYSEENLRKIYSNVRLQYGKKAEPFINFVEKVWKYKIIPIARAYSINNDQVYGVGQVLLLCEACKDTLKLVGKFATSAKRQDFLLEKDADGNMHKKAFEYAPTFERRGYYAGLNRITSKNWESERSYDSLDIARDNELGGGNNRITIFDKKVELPNFLLMEPDKSYPKAMHRNGIHEIALNYLPRGMLGTPNSIGCLRLSDFGSKFFRWWTPQNTKLFIAYQDSLYLIKEQSNPINYLPFKTLEEGNKFRKWINEKHPSFAKRFDISIDGDYKNGFIIDGYYFFKNEYDKINKN